MWPSATFPGCNRSRGHLDDVIMIGGVRLGKRQRPPARDRGKETPAILATHPLKRVANPRPRQPPHSGAGVLRLTVTPRPLVLKKDEKRAPPEPRSLERVFLAVNSPPVEFSGHVGADQRLDESARRRAFHSADGAMFFDTATGEAYAAAVRRDSGVEALLLLSQGVRKRRFPRWHGDDRLRAPYYLTTSAPSSRCVPGVDKELGDVTIKPNRTLVVGLR